MYVYVYNIQVDRYIGSNSGKNDIEAKVKTTKKQIYTHVMVHFHARAICANRLVHDSLCKEIVA